MKTAVITGASSGIGELTAKSLAQNGYNVVLAARREYLLNDIAVECRKHGVEALVVQADVSKKEHVERIAASAVQRFGGFDVWINNAGVIMYGRFLDISPEEFRQVMETNMFGCVYGARVALTQFYSQGYGALINVASGYGAVPSPFASAYVASKFAVRGLSASLREELIADGIKNVTVSTILPATMDTPVYASGANKMGYKVVALPPVSDPKKVADAIVNVIESPKAEVSVGKLMRVPIVLFNIAPGFFMTVFSKYVLAFGYKKRVPTAVTSGNLFVPSTNAGGGVRGGWKKTDHKTGAMALLAGVIAVTVLCNIHNRRK